MGNTLEHLEVTVFESDFDIDLTEEELDYVFLRNELYEFVCVGVPHDTWISKTCSETDLRRILSQVLQCDTSDWSCRQLCTMGLKKLHPEVTVLPFHHEKNKFWLTRSRGIVIQYPKLESLDVAHFIEKYDQNFTS